MRKRFLPAAAFTLVFSVHGFAQTRPTIDVGAETLSAFAFGGGSTGTFILRGSLPRSERVAIEPFLTYHRDERTSWGLYGMHWRRTFAAGDHTQAFATYGVSGAYAAGYVFAPLIPIAGVGVRRETASGFALRADAQVLFALVIPFGSRLSATVSVPLGHRR